MKRLMQKGLSGWIIATATLIGLFLSLAGCNPFSNASTDIVDIQENDEINKQHYVNATGNVYLDKEVTLSFKINAYDIKILFESGQHVEKGEILVESNITKLISAIEEAKAQLSREESLYDNLIREDRREVRQSEKDAALERLEFAQATLDLAEKNLEAAFLKAPFDGTIIEIYRNSYENVFAGEPILLIADENSLQIKTNNLDDEEIGKVNIGDQVEIFFDAFPNETINGVVVDIAQKSSGGAENSFNVSITPLEKLDGLLWGMSAYVEIDVESEPIISEKEEGNAQTKPETLDEVLSETDSQAKRECENANFISETIPDDSKLSPGEKFVKEWTLRNVGTCTWNTNYKLRFVNGEKMGGPDFIFLPDYVAPDDLVKIELPLSAPAKPGMYKGEWHLQNEIGGDIEILWVDILIE